MGVKTPLHYRAPTYEHGYDQGGRHKNDQNGVWQTVMDISNVRGTMFIRLNSVAGNAWVEMRVTIDGVAYPIYHKSKGSGNDPWWIFDFNDSVKIEDYTQTANNLDIEYGYNHWRP